MKRLHSTPVSNPNLNRKLHSRRSSGNSSHSHSHHPPSSPSPLRQSWSGNKGRGITTENQELDSIHNHALKHVESSPTSANSEIGYTPLSFSAFSKYQDSHMDSNQTMMTTNWNSSPSFNQSYSSRIDHIDFNSTTDPSSSNQAPPQQSMHITSSTSPLPFTTLSSPSSTSTSSQPQLPKYRPTISTLDQKRTSIFHQSSNPRFNRNRPNNKDTEEPSQTLFRQRFKERCRAHMQRDRARALAKARASSSNNAREFQLTPGPSTGGDGRKGSMIGSDDLMSSDIEEDGQGGFEEEMQVDQSWQLEDDEVSRS